MRWKLICTLLGLPIIVAGADLSLCRITADKLRVRLGPGLDYGVCVLLGKDEEAISCGTVDGWRRVYLPRTSQVYIFGEDLSLEGTGPNQGRTATCVRETIARKEPDRNEVAVGRVAKGTEVKLLRKYGVWWAVEPPLNLTGYVKSDFLEEIQGVGESTAEAILGRSLVALPEPPQLDSVKEKVEEPKGESYGPEPLAGKEVSTEKPERSAGRVAPAVHKVSAARKESPGTRNLSITTWNEEKKELWLKYCKVCEAAPEGWDFSEVKAVCNKLIEENPGDGNKQFGEMVLEAVKRRERIKELLTKPPISRKLTFDDKEEDITEGENEPIAVGWVAGRGRYMERRGTHALERGGEVIYYLEGKGVDLDACVNKRVAILAGEKEKLPPSYGCDLIRVEQAKVLSR